MWDFKIKCNCNHNFKISQDWTSIKDNTDPILAELQADDMRSNLLDGTHNILVALLREMSRPNDVHLPNRGIWTSAFQDYSVNNTIAVPLRRKFEVQWGLWWRVKINKRHLTSMYTLYTLYFTTYLHTLLWLHVYFTSGTASFTIRQRYWGRGIVYAIKWDGNINY